MIKQNNNINELIYVPYCKILFRKNKTIDIDERIYAQSLFIDFFSKVSVNDPVLYEFYEIEEALSSKSRDDLISLRYQISKDFYYKYFCFISEELFDNATKLFIYSVFLDQVANNCFAYIDFREPRISDVSIAFESVKKLALEKNFDSLSVRLYIDELTSKLVEQNPIKYISLLYYY